MWYLTGNCAETVRFADPVVKSFLLGRTLDPTTLMIDTTTTIIAFAT